MPTGDSFSRAIELVDRRMRQLEGARRLTSGELQAYAMRSPVAGWSISVGFPTESAQEIKILADCDFPYSRPLIANSGSP